MNINEITYKINGAIFEVNRILGPGFLEKVYENALLIEIRECGLKVENQVPINVKYKDNNVGEYFADLLVEEKVIEPVRQLLTQNESLLERSRPKDVIKKQITC